MWIFYLIFFEKIEKLNFPGKNFSRKFFEFSVKNRDFFILVRYKVDKTSCKRFLKSVKNHAIFEFSFVFLTHCIAPLFFDWLVGNWSQKIVLVFLFHNLTNFKNIYEFLMWFLKKKKKRKMHQIFTIEIQIEISRCYFSKKNTRQWNFSLKITKITQNFWHFYDIFPLCFKFMSVYDVTLPLQ